MRVLKQATEEALEFDVCTPEIYKALDFLKTDSIRTWGFTLFYEGLEKGNAQLMQEGYKLIKQHLGL